MSFDIRKIREDAKVDWQRAWVESAKMVSAESGKDYAGGVGSPHPMHELVAKTRRVFLGLGFDEVENPVFIGEEDVYKQYGPEAPVILDRVYYLAGLPRPDIGLSDEKLLEVQTVLLEEEQGVAKATSAGRRTQLEKDLLLENLQKIFRDYRAGKIEGDDLLENMTTRFKIRTQTASKILDLFPEFKNLQPVAGKLTLRSHMTGAWFPTLSALVGEKLPQKLFSVGLRFRREQKVDATHLRAHYGGSMVVADEDIGSEAGKKLTIEILSRLGFEDIKFEKKKATSHYYAPDTEYEVYSKNIEIADIGMYSPVALANYGISYNVFNLGFGLERMIMVKTGAKDVRELLYPQFHRVIEYSDEQLVEQISIEAKPSTKEGVALSAAIKKVGVAHANEKSPCSFKAFEGVISGKKVVVNVVEREANTMLLGPAALNEIFVHESGVYGIPKDTSKLKENVAEIQTKGIKLDFGFIDAISDYFAAEVERKVAAGEREGFIQLKMAKGPSDVNISVGERARRFIESKNKQISLKGPVFSAVEFKVL